MTLNEILTVYTGSDADATKALYEKLSALGPKGLVAVNVFRAMKASERAKKYRGGPRGGGSYRGMAYDRKSWSMMNLCDTLKAHSIELDIVWGWSVDTQMQQRGDPHHHVLYIDLPTGQVSFHNGTRLGGPNYTKPWDRVIQVGPQRICSYCATILNGDDK